MLAAAATSRQIGVARWVAAVVAERAGDVEVAEAHLHLGIEADPSSAALVGAAPGTHRTEAEHARR